MDEKTFKKLLKKAKKDYEDAKIQVVLNELNRRLEEQRIAKKKAHDSEFNKTLEEIIK